MLRNTRFWGTAGLLALVSVFHYYDLLGIPYTPPATIEYALTRHATDRVLFLFPMVYAGFVFGLRAGLGVAGVSFAVMLPRAVALDAFPAASVLEVLVTVAVGAMASIWFSVRVKERDQYKKALAELEVTHHQLQRYVRAARSSEKRLTILNAISTMLSQSLDPQQIMQQAVGMVTELIEVEAALLYLLNEQGETLTLAAHLGVSDEFASEVRTVRVGDGFIGRVAVTGEPLVARDFSHDPRMGTAEARRMKFERQLVVPVRCKGKIVGTLCVAMRRPREFLNEEVDLVTAIASQIGVSVENARLYDRERETARELRLSERRYRAIFEGASDAIWVHDLEGTVTAVNSATARLTGYTVEEMVGTKVQRLLAKEGMDLARGMRRKLLEGGGLDAPYEQRLVRRDGKEVAVMLTTSLIREEGRPVGFQNIARDVTAERRMQENLRFYLERSARAQEEERRRIARELHDDTMQALYALSRQVDTYARDNTHLRPWDVQFLQGVQRQVKEALDGIQRFAQDLRPPMLDELGWLSAIRWLLSEAQKQAGLRAELCVLGQEHRFSPEAELTLFRIVQEGVRNVERHAHASYVLVTVEFQPAETRVVVQDDGAGFEPPEKVEDLPRAGKLGLAGVHERAGMLGGTLHIRSHPGAGTTITVEIPI